MHTDITGFERRRRELRRRVRGDVDADRKTPRAGETRAAPGQAPEAEPGTVGIQSPATDETRTKAELMAALDELGLSYNPRDRKASLSALLAEHDVPEGGV